MVEVTGINGQITKDSKKLTQVFSALQKAAPTDRICVAVNAYRDKPPNERKNLDVTTREAHELLTRLNAVVFTTSDLFDAWTICLDDRSRAQSILGAIASSAAGIVRLR